MNFSELKVADNLRIAYRFWWIFVLTITAGGIVGLLVNKFLPPIYEARSSFAVTVDFSQTGGDISDYNLDQAVSVVQDIYYSIKVFDQVVEKSQLAHDLVFTTSDLLSEAAIERENETWWLIIRNKDPKTAEQILDIWAKLGYQQLSAAHAHAFNAERLQIYQTQINICPSAPVLDPPLYVVCEPTVGVDPESLLRIQERIEEEILQSQGVNRSLVFSEPDTVYVQQDPVMYKTNWMVFGGMFAGFFTAVALLAAIQKNFGR